MRSLCTFSLLWLFDLVVAAATGSKTAYIEIVFCDSSRSSSVYSEKLEGLFASIGLLGDAEGDVLQIHPLGLCNISNSDSLYEDEWVGVVKLTVPSEENAACNDTVQKALGAIKKGAKAVIFDITDSPGAAHELNTGEAMVHQPVIIVSDESAKKLMRIVSRQKVLRAKISWQLQTNEVKTSSGEYVDMVIFMTCFILITITCFVLLLKIKWRQTKKESSLAKMAFDAVSKMESKKYAEAEETTSCVGGLKVLKERQISVHSCSAIGFACVICLEEFKDGQEIRVVSCGHEFHLKCVDPWLLTNYTCPLCMLNIVEREGKGIKSDSRCSLTFRSIFHCCFSSTPLSSSSMVYSVTSDEASNDGLSVSSNDTVESVQFYPVYTNSKQPLRPEHSLQAVSTYSVPIGLQYIPCPVRNDNLNTGQSGVSRTTQSSTEHWQMMQERKQRALQLASDRGNGKYSDIGDAV